MPLHVKVVDVLQGPSHHHVRQDLQLRPLDVSLAALGSITMIFHFQNKPDFLTPPSLDPLKMPRKGQRSYFKSGLGNPSFGLVQTFTEAN